MIHSVININKNMICIGICIFLQIFLLFLYQYQQSMTRYITQVLGIKILNRMFHNIQRYNSDDLINGKEHHLHYSLIGEITKIENILYILLQYLLPITVTVSYMIFVCRFYIPIKYNILLILMHYIQHISPKANTKFHKIHKIIFDKMQNLSIEKFWSHKNFDDYVIMQHKMQNREEYNIMIFILQALYGFMVIFYSLNNYTKIHTIITFLLTTFFIKYINNIFYYIKQIQYNYSDILHKYLQTPKNKKYNLKYLSPSGDIEIRNLCYRKLNVVLKNIDCSIHSGDKIAVVGHKGKTELLNIIAGILVDYEGQIFINNVNLQYVEQKSIQLNCGYITKIHKLFNNITIKENILMGKKILNLQEILQITNLDYLISNNELNKIVTPELYQEQNFLNKIAIARGLVALENKKLLLIDDPYNINADLCLKILKSDIMQNKTIIIADTGSVFTFYMNKILFIQPDGTSIFDTHKSLLENNENYQNLIGNN